MIRLSITNERVKSRKFLHADSELETAAREILGEEFAFIASAYGFDEADVEELIATRDWQPRRRR